MAYTSWSVVFGEQPSAAKWNILGTNDSSFNDGTGIGSGAISQPAQLVSGSGTSWVWQTWSPTLTNLSGGTQTYAKYVQIGKTIHFRFKYTLAGAGVSGAVGFTIPVTKATGYGDTDAATIHHSVLLRDEGVGDYIGFTAFGSASRLDVYALAADVANLSYRSTSSTVPFTWGNTDSISVHGSYEAA